MNTDDDNIQYNTSTRITKSSLLNDFDDISEFSLEEDGPTTPPNEQETLPDDEPQDSILVNGGRRTTPNSRRNQSSSSIGKNGNSNSNSKNSNSSNTYHRNEESPLDKAKATLVEDAKSAGVEVCIC